MFGLSSGALTALSQWWLDTNHPLTDQIFYFLFFIFSKQHLDIWRIKHSTRSAANNSFPWLQQLVVKEVFSPGRRHI
jgi:hypothetical protein